MENPNIRNCPTHDPIEFLVKLAKCPLLARSYFAHLTLDERHALRMALADTRHLQRNDDQEPRIE